MGISFRKRLKIMKGLYLNFSKNGVSTSVGTPGATLNFGKNGTRVTTSIPGTGIRYTKKLSGNKNTNKNYHFDDVEDVPLTIDTYNFTGKKVTEGSDLIFYVALVVSVFALFVFGALTLIISIPVLLYIFFVYLKKQEELEIQEENKIEEENKIIRNKLKKLLKKSEAIDLMLEVNDTRTLGNDIEEIKSLFNELSKYPISYFMNEDKFFKLMAKAEEKNQNYYEALRLSTIVVHQYKPTKEIKKILANSLNKLNLDVTLEDYLDFIDNNSYTTVLEKIDELTNN